MPDWVTNELRCSDVVRRALTNDKGDVDFNRVIPTDHLWDEAGMLRPEYRPSLPWMSPLTELWGCKWNARLPQENDEQRLRFQTPWSQPLPVIVELSARYPDEVIECRFADEDLGCNCGEYKIKAGEVYDDVVEGMPSGAGRTDQEWRKFAFHLLEPAGDNSPEVYGYDDEFNLIEE